MSQWLGSLQIHEFNQTAMRLKEQQQKQLQQSISSVAAVAMGNPQPEDERSSSVADSTTADNIIEQSVINSTTAAVVMSDTHNPAIHQKGGTVLESTAAACLPPIVNSSEHPPVIGEDKEFDSAEQLKKEMKSQVDGELMTSSTSEQPVNLTPDSSSQQTNGEGAGTGGVQPIVESEVNAPFPAAGGDSYEPSVAVQSSESSLEESKDSDTIEKTKRNRQT
jgi:hypothetical protein